MSSPFLETNLHPRGTPHIKEASLMRETPQYKQSDLSGQYKFHLTAEDKNRESSLVAKRFL